MDYILIGTKISLCMKELTKMEKKTDYGLGGMRMDGR